MDMLVIYKLYKSFINIDVQIVVDTHLNAGKY